MTLELGSRRKTLTPFSCHLNKVFIVVCVYVYVFMFVYDVFMTLELGSRRREDIGTIFVPFEQGIYRLFLCVYVCMPVHFCV
jgi:hypothetical protein